MSFDPSKFKAIGESSNATFYEFDHEVLVVLPNEGSADTQASATQSVQIQLDYLRTRNRRSGVVVLMDNVMAQDAGARGVYRELPDPSHQVCFALVGGTAFGRVVCSLFVSLSPPKSPTKVFANFEEAVTWVRAMVRRNE